jgi:hypothetical protein
MPPDMYRPDPELAAWIEALLDQHIGEEEARKLADRLRDDPEARSYCAEIVRFDAAMQDELCPQEIEWTDTRRVTLTKRNGNPEFEVQRNQSVRVGAASGALIHDVAKPRGEESKHWLGGLLLLALIAAGLLVWHGRGKPVVTEAPSLRLWNGDFEATNLTYLSEPTNPALVDWQDYFVTENADVAEISRVTNGKVLPKSGRNVARLSNFAYLTQRLRKSDTSQLLAEPGLSVAVSGWAYVLETPSPAGDGKADGGKETSGKPALRGSLRFVAGGSPGMVQYEAANAAASLTIGDWQRFRLELTLPSDLVLSPSYGVSQAKLDLRGKELTLSLDSECEHGYQLLLDDLSIEEVR